MLLTVAEFQTTAHICYNKKKTCGAVTLHNKYHSRSSSEPYVQYHFHALLLDSGSFYIGMLASASPLIKHAIGVYFRRRNVAAPLTELHELRHNLESNSCERQLKGGNNPSHMNLVSPHENVKCNVAPLKDAVKQVSLSASSPCWQSRQSRDVITQKMREALHDLTCALGGTNFQITISHSSI